MKRLKRIFLTDWFFYGVFPIVWVVAVCGFMVWQDWDLTLLWQRGGYMFVFFLMIIFGLGYTTASTFLTGAAIKLKLWSLPIGAAVMAATYAVYHYWLQDMPVVLSVGWFFASIPLGMLLWVDNNKDKQSYLYSDEDSKRLMKFCRNSIKNDPLALDSELPKRTGEPVESFLVDFHEEKYEKCSRELLSYAVGEIIFPGAYVFAEDVNDKVSIIMKEQKGEPSVPNIFCDGSNSAIMVYNDTTTIALCIMADDFYENFHNHTHLYAYEITLGEDSERIAKEYYVPITYIDPKAKELDAEVEVEIPAKYANIELPQRTDEELRSELIGSYEEVTDDEIFRVKELLARYANECDIFITKVAAVVGFTNIEYTLHTSEEVTDDVANYLERRVGKYCKLTYETGSKTLKFDMPYLNQIDTDYNTVNA